MPESPMSATEWLVLVLTYPRLFQEGLMAFAWGADNSTAVMVLKRVFLLLPVSALLFALWASIPNLLSALFRSRRAEFISGFLASWWELGHSAFAYAAGLVKAGLLLLGHSFGVLRLAVAGLWLLLVDILLAPFRAVRTIGKNVAAPGLPWIATVLTVAWCALEAVIFTYVMTPLVMDTLTNLTGQDLHEAVVRVPLYLFLLILVLGSYAVLSVWTKAVKDRDVAAIVRITAVESVAVLVEVMFLYREFVDALVPWFAMHAGEGFEPGAALVLTIAFLVWLGVRGMTWFLFASHGTPILMAVIQGQGLGAPAGDATPAPAAEYLGYSGAYYTRIRQDADWLTARGNDVTNALVIPPMQVLAASLNFLTLLIMGKPIFHLPFKDVRELLASAKFLRSPSRRNHEAGEGGQEVQP